MDRLILREKSYFISQKNYSAPNETSEKRIFHAQHKHMCILKVQCILPRDALYDIIYIVTRTDYNIRRN